MTDVTKRALCKKYVRISMQCVNLAHPNKQGLPDRRNKKILNVFPVCRVCWTTKNTDSRASGTHSADWKDINYCLVTAVMQPSFIRVCGIYKFQWNSHTFCCLLLAFILWNNKAMVYYCKLWHLTTFHSQMGSWRGIGLGEKDKQYFVVTLGLDIFFMSFI
jgi:hypothetical protein